MNGSSPTSGLEFLQTTKGLAPLPRKRRNAFVGSSTAGVMAHGRGVWELPPPYTGASSPALTALAQALRGGDGTTSLRLPSKGAHRRQLLHPPGRSCNSLLDARTFLLLSTAASKGIQRVFWLKGKG